MTDLIIAIEDIAELATPVGLHGAALQAADSVFAIVVGVVVATR